MPPADSESSYDENLLVEMLAAGKFSCREIAEKVGKISAAMVSAISQGRRRRDLHDRVTRAVAAAQRRAVRLAAGRLADLVDRHVAQGLASDDPEARRCREFLLRTYTPKTLAEPPAAPLPKEPHSPFANFKKLSPETQARIAHDLGGPAPDQTQALEQDGNDNGGEVAADSADSTDSDS